MQFSGETVRVTGGGEYRKTPHEGELRNCCTDTLRCRQWRDPRCVPNLTPTTIFPVNPPRKRRDGCYPECLRLSPGQAEKLDCTKGNSRILSCLPSAESNYARETWQPLPAKLLPIVRQPHRRHLQTIWSKKRRLRIRPTVHTSYYKRLSAVAGSKVRLYLAAIARVEAMMCRRVRGGTVRRRPIAESKR